MIYENEKIEIKPSLIQPLKEIKSLGTFKVKIILHSEVEGEIEIKELWFSAFFYRTQVAFRGEVPKEIVEDYLANLV